MKIITSIKKMQILSESIRLNGKKIGFVPTMGFLHEGHLKLLKIARKKCDILILSIFVNPTQFGPKEDFNKYPRNFKSDKELANDMGVDILFYPQKNDLYPIDFQTFVYNENLSNIYEGEFRPTHFKGVTTIVAKLFNIIKPHIVIFGQKDAQQVAIITRMIKDLNFDMNIIVAPIVRDFDGLALSSRNVYLNKNERNEALVLNHSLDLAGKLIKNGERNCGVIISKLKTLICSQKSAKIDYIRIILDTTFQELSILRKNTHIVILLAVKFGKTRLIDNRKMKV